VHSESFDRFHKHLCLNVQPRSLRHHCLHEETRQDNLNLVVGLEAMAMGLEALAMGLEALEMGLEALEMGQSHGNLSEDYCHLCACRYTHSSSSNRQPSNSRSMHCNQACASMHCNNPYET
jgi:hypothetical protein